MKKVIRSLFEKKVQRQQDGVTETLKETGKDQFKQLIDKGLSIPVVYL